MAIQGGSVQLGPWTGGVIYNRPAEDVGPEELSSMENCRINPAGAVEKRKGFANYQGASTVGGTTAVTGVHEFEYTSSASVVVITAGAAIYKYDSGWSAITGSVTITAGDDNNYKFVTTGEKDTNNRMVAVNGVNPPLVWNASGNVAVLDLDSRFTYASEVAWWDNRLWMGNTNAHDNRIWRSNILDIETWGATDFYNMSEAITALVPMQNSLSIHTRGGIHTLTPTGNSTIPFQQQQTTQAGTIASRGCLTLPNERQIFVRPDGIYMWSGSDQINKISYQLDDGYWTSLNSARLEFIHAVYYASVNEVWFFVPYGTSTKMNHVIIYNERFDTWYGPYSGFDRGSSGIVDNKPHAGAFDGKLYDMVSTNDNDDGTSISANFITGSVAPQGGETRLRWLYSRTFFDDAGDYNVLVTQESGGLIGTSENLNMGQGAFKLGSSKLDQDKMGSLRMLSGDLNMQGYDSQSSLQYQNNNSNQFFRIRRAHMIYQPIGKMRRSAQL